MRPEPEPTKPVILGDIAGGVCPGRSRMARILGVGHSFTMMVEDYDGHGNDMHQCVHCGLNRHVEPQRGRPLEGVWC